MFQGKCLILDNKKIGPSYFLLRLQAPEIAKECQPGQFLHIKCSLNYSSLLRRPLSIHRVLYQSSVISNQLPEDQEPRTKNQEQGTGVGVGVLYKVVGRGTTLLSQRKRGEKIDLVGPLGKGFEVEDLRQQSRAILVAGGMGVAPLIFLAEKLAKLKIKNQKSKIVVFIGAKNRQEVLCKEEFQQLGAEVEIATEDGSLGYKGLISELLKNRLSTMDYGLSTVLYACGPKAMLKEIALLSQQHRIPCQVSLEQFMGCGIGACHCCVVRTTGGYKRVCKEGPVFLAGQILWGDS